ncbi:MAG: class I SAM-dependent methyltransferase [Paenibacillaceae bacterium]
MSKKTSGKVLDVGCGSGALLDTYRDNGWETYGIEISKEACTNANQKGHNVSKYSIEQYETDKKFSLIILQSVFEHLHNPDLALDKIRHLLDDDGRVIITVPNMNSIHYKLFNQYYWGIDSPRHLYLYNVENIRRLAEKKGFNIEYTTTISSPSGVIISMYNWIFESFGKRFFLAKYKAGLLDLILVMLLYFPSKLIDLFKSGDYLKIVMSKSKDSA